MIIKEPEIRALMKRNNWTQEQLAAEIGVSQSTVQRWLESGAIPGPKNQDILSKMIADGDNVSRPATPGDISGGNVSTTAGLIDRILRMPEKEQFKIARFMDIIDDD